MNYFQPVIKKLEFDELIEEVDGKKGKKRFLDIGIFHLWCQEILRNVSAEEIEWSKQATKALMQNSEDYLIQLFEDSNYCAEHCGRVTLQVKDMQLARRIRSRFECFIGSSIVN